MKKLLLGVAATAIMVTGAMAADLGTTPATYDSTTFDWDGFYVGVGITGLSAPSVPVTAITGDIIAGFNATSSEVLFGAEAWVGYGRNSLGGQGTEIGASARLGYLVAPEVLTYVSGGLQRFNSSGFLYATLGGGVEFAATNDLSFDLEYKFANRINLTPLSYHSLTASANWHF